MVLFYVPFEDVSTEILVQGEYDPRAADCLVSYQGSGNSLGSNNKGVTDSY